MVVSNAPIPTKTIKDGLADRLRLVSMDFARQKPGQRLCDVLGLPPRTLQNYESGCTIPAEVILAIIHTLGIHPNWLMTGQGARYRPASVNLD